MHLRLRAWGLLAIAALLPACGIGGSGTLNPTVAPGIPSGVVALPGNHSVTLTWAASAQGSSYSILRSIDPAGPFFPVSVPAQFQAPTTYVDPGLQNKTPYYYQIQASNQFGQSAPSAVVSATPGFKAVMVSGSPNSVAVGSNDLLALLPDGSVWEWGINKASEASCVPVQVQGLTQITSISSGPNCNLALDSAGTVWAWGRNIDDVLGTGFPLNAETLVPAPVQNLSGVIAIAAGENHSVALAHDGTVWAWGDNTYAQLGVVPTSLSGSPTPIQVGGLSNIIAIAAGSAHTLAIRNDGLLIAWGRNESGQLGSVSTAYMLPQFVPNLTGVIAVAAGGENSLALKTDGSLWGFGANLSGCLGIGSATAPVAPPAMVLGLSGIVAMSCSGEHGLAVRSDGAVFAWGNNSNDQLGNAGASPSYTPSQVAGLTGIVKVAAAAATSVAIAADGTVSTWGSNLQGEMGIGSGEFASIPIQLNNVVGATAIAGGGDFSTSVRTLGAVWTWGGNDTGQFGNGATSAAGTPIPVYASPLLSITAVAAGGGYVLALKSDGTVWAWGQNNEGQIGQGTTSVSVNTPTQVPALSSIRSVAAGADHCMAITTGQTLYTWGWNGTSQLGNTAAANNPTATLVPGLTGVIFASAGEEHSLVVLKDGSVWAWGSNANGQLGIPAAGTGNLATPTPIPGLSGIQAVAAGYTHSLALGSDGTVWAWGQGIQGQLGNGSAADSSTPIQVPGLSGITAIAAGQDFSLALRQDGTVWAWGINNLGDLGFLVPGISPVPGQVSGLTGVIAISAGAQHGLALLGNGTIFGWGLNAQGQAGMPITTQSASPVVINP